MPNPWRDAGSKFRDGPIPNNPLRPEQIDVLLALAAVEPPARILDLGCGPGLLAQRFLEEFPDAHVTALDFAPHMVEQARARLGTRAKVLQGSLEDPLPGEHDLVLAVQTAHHLDDEAKQAWYREVFRVLAPGGLMLQSDPVTPGGLFAHHVALMNRARAAAGFDPLPADYDRAAFDEQMARQGDRLAPLAVQMQWMREAGFVSVECFWSYGNRAIWSGRKPVG